MSPHKWMVCQHCLLGTSDHNRVMVFHLLQVCHSSTMATLLPVCHNSTMATLLPVCHNSTMANRLLDIEWLRASILLVTISNTNNPNTVLPKVALLAKSHHITTA